VSGNRGYDDLLQSESLLFDKNILSGYKGRPVLLKEDAF